MKSMELIPFQDLAKLHKEQPGVYPVFGKIRRLNGKLVGEVKGYSDAYGNRLNITCEENRFLS